MEIELSNAEKSEQVRRSSDDQDLGHARSYRCSFCKRGFSNAQALGGHMNIHRKDRARLKEFAIENSSLSLDITKTAGPDQSPSSVLGEALQLQSGDERSCTPKRPCTSPVEIDHDTGDVQDGFGDELQLTLSFDTSSPISSNEKEEHNFLVGRHVKRSMQVMSLDASQTELDLELRLGPEPHEAARKG